MSSEEFENNFDILFNNVTSNQAPGLDSFEKSVFLTKAQDEVVKAYFSPKLNKPQEGFDGSERRQIDFSMITTTSYPTLTKGTKNGYYTTTLPDAMMIINEFITVSRNSKDVDLTVIPLSYEEWARQISKPYKRPLHYQAWRVINNGKEATIIIGHNDAAITTNPYTIRYVRRPYPILLQDFTDEGLTIHGQSKPLNMSASAIAQFEKVYEQQESQEDGEVELVDSGNYTLKNSTYNEVCELDPILHEEILQRAVELAKAAYVGNLESQIALGQASETNMGIAASSNNRQ